MNEQYKPIQTIMSVFAKVNKYEIDIMFFAE